MIRNLHWLDRNAQASYPLDDRATAVSDSGVRLPSDILVDLHLRWPESLGRYAFLAALAATEHAISFVVQAAPDVDSVSGFVPLGAVTVAADAPRGRPVAFVAQQPGVSGWAVPGPARLGPFRGQFSSPLQSLLAPKAARPYREPAVTGLSTPAGATLTGIVDLEGKEPLEITVEAVEIAGVLRDCIVFRLVEGDQSAFGESTSAGVFRTLAGPCGGRPESRTCGSPQPLEFLNAVGPDCDGTVIVRFTGCALLGALDPCGIVVDCDMGLAEACPGKHLPDEDGRLPGDKDPEPLHEWTDPPEAGDSESISESITVSAELPLILCLAHTIAADQLTVVSGTWGFSSVVEPPPRDVCGDSRSDDDPTGAVMVFGTETGTQRHMTVWNGFDVTTAFRRVTAELFMEAGESGSRHNGSVVLNRRETFTGSGVYTYHQFLVDRDAKVFRLQRFNGISFINYGSALVPSLALNRWYTVTVDVVPGPGGTNVSLTATLADETGVLATIGPVAVAAYKPSTGLFGLAADRAVTRFGYFSVELIDG